MDARRDTIQQALSLWRRFVDLVRLEQTVFALPFAYAGMLLAADGLPTPAEGFWVTAAMVGARTAGMSANRLVDRELDAQNPRTRDRALPQGTLSVSTVRMTVAVSLGLLLLAAWNLNPLCLALLPVAAVLLLGYSYLKRFTWACHLGLGAVQACAPLGGWLAVSGEWAFAPFLLGLASFLWVAGFDILYACQDTEHDLRHDIRSLPAALGKVRAFKVARAFHCGTVVALGLAGASLALGPAYFTGVGLIGAVLVWEHELLRPDDLSRMPIAFFQANALVGLILFASVLLEVLL
ncbi:MAG: UbiA family prenyltransferase [Armatimonadetes bacterium]|nr:UbiA family prenyltransferase [Armatimonadota bacterium]